MRDDLVKKSKSAACNLKHRDILRNGSEDVSELGQSPEWVAADVLEQTADRIAELEAERDELRSELADARAALHVIKSYVSNKRIRKLAEDAIAELKGTNQ